MECGECTACCFAFPVVELEKDRFTECEYADCGCKIYTLRPESCRKCHCAWITQPDASIELRPDKCGVVFEKVDSSTMVGTIIEDSYSSLVSAQIEDFKKQDYTVILQKKV